MTLHACHVRRGTVLKDLRYDALEACLEQHLPISVPTVVLHGDEDGASLVQSSAGQEKWFTGGYRQEVLPGVGHFVQRKHPQAVWDAVLGSRQHKGYNNTRSTTMNINIKTTGASHIALRCTDLVRARRFYTETLGFPIIAETPELFLVQAGSTAIGLRAPTPDTAPGDTFSDSRVGLDHIALNCESDAELERVAVALSAGGVENTGIKTDEVLGKRYVAFNDPDGIIWDLYMV